MPIRYSNTEGFVECSESRFDGETEKSDQHEQKRTGYEKIETALWRNLVLKEVRESNEGRLVLFA